jgi:hypothetical protein
MEHNTSLNYLATIWSLLLTLGIVFFNLKPVKFVFHRGIFGLCKDRHLEKDYGELYYYC